MAIRTLPPAPQRTDSPPVFVTKADNWVATLPLWTDDANALQTDVNAKQALAAQSVVDAATQVSLATTQAGNAALSAANAQASATQAAVSAGAGAWVSGTTYALNAVVISQINFYAYRKKTASSVSVVDPANDNTNWVSAVPTPAQVKVARSSNTQLTAANATNLINFSSTFGFTQTFAAPSVLGNGWFIRLQNISVADTAAGIELESPATVSTTSTSSNSILAGTSWQVPAGLSISAGHLVIIRRTSDPYSQRIVGTVQSYSGTTLIITAQYRFGSVTATDWTITTRPATAGFDGYASIVMYNGEVRDVTCDGTSLTSVVIQPYYISMSASFNFVSPFGYSGTNMDLVGGGGGGGGGGRSASGSGTMGGAPGGAPARVIRSIFGTSPNIFSLVQVGSGGNAGAGATVDSTAGAPGNTGGNTAFGTLFTAFGGYAGAGGLVSTTQASGTTGSGSLSQGGTGTVANQGGQPSSAYFGGTLAANTIDNIGEGGGATQVNSRGGNTVYGGASSSLASGGGTTIAQSGSSIFGVPAGGQGGWITSSSTFPATAGEAGLRGSYTAGGLAGGTCGSSPTSGTAGAVAANDSEVGGSGSGGGSGVTGVTGRAGGNGGYPGGAGGGGGASLNGSVPGGGGYGNGGSGAGGRAIITGII